MLSVAMIVKNEQKNLPRCLESLKGLFAELIVVDTGSLDQTVKIAKDYGAKVYHHLWEDNFAKHRNQSFSYATGDWIFQIDADEELVFFNNRNPRILLDFLSRVKSSIHAITLELTDMCAGKQVATMHPVRIFRRGKVKYKRRIHNEPMFKGNVGIFPFGKLNHYGYDLEPYQRKVKAKRTIELLHQSLEEDPKDYDSMFYISQAYSQFGLDNIKSLRWAEEYAKHRSNIAKGKFHESVYYSIIIMHMKNDDMKQCWKWLEIALKEIPGDLDINMALLRYGLLTNNQNLVGAGARAFVTSYHSFKKDTVKRAARFAFSYNEDSLAFALFHLSVTYLEHSKIELERLYAVMPNISKKLADELQQGLKSWFDKNETIFKHTDSMLQASKTAGTLYSLSPKPNKQRLRALINTR